MKWQTNLTKIEMENLICFQQDNPDCEEYILRMESCGIGTKITVQGVAHFKVVEEKDITDYGCW